MNIASEDFEPFHDWVLIRPFKMTEYLVGSIIVPAHSGSNSPGQGSVVSAGPLSNLKKDDVVYFNRGAGVEADEDGETVKLLRDLPDLIYGRVKPKE